MMEIFLGYLIQNWALILVLIAFAIMLRITVFLNKATIVRMYALIIAIFILSILVYIEFYLAEINTYPYTRLSMMAIRYSATPIIISLVLFTMLKKWRWYVLIPALAAAIINIVSIFTGIVFGIDSEGELIRGVLGYLPFIMVGVYSAGLIVLMIYRSDRKLIDIIPISFLAFAFISGLIFPFVIGKEYSKIFVTTVGVALFVYYVFLILQLTKKDALTGLLNRQAYYAAIHGGNKDATGFISIDMNGLKAINDNLGHSAGDHALIKLAHCILQATDKKHSCFRLGGDEFVVICRKCNEEEVLNLVKAIKENVSKTPYSCSIGYSYSSHGEKNLKAMIRESDAMMYQDKANYYNEEGKNRRHV